MDDSFDIIDLIIIFGIPSYLLLQVVSLNRLTARWRKAAFVPLVLAVPIALWCFAAFVGQSNLWPLPFIFFAPLGTLYLVVLLTMRAIKGIC
jgi:hypothetical protein